MFVLRSFYGILIHLYIFFSQLVDYIIQLLYSGYRQGPIFMYRLSNGYWSVAGASRPSWLLYIDTMETTLGGQFFTFNSVNRSCKSIKKICRLNPIIIISIQVQIK